jgi:hypothetical protein
MGTFAKTSIVDYRFIVCRPRKKHFRFPLVPFSVCGIPETLKHGHGDKWTWGLGDMENGVIETRTWRHQTEYRSPGDFPYSVYRLLIVQTEVCHLSVCWWRNKRTKWTWPSMLLQHTILSVVTWIFNIFKTVPSLFCIPVEYAGALNIFLVEGTLFKQSSIYMLLFIENLYV